MKKIFTETFIAIITMFATLNCRLAMAESQQEEISFASVNYAKEAETVEETTVEEVEEPKTVEVIDTNNIFVNLNEYGLELPISGATGYTSTELNLYSDEDRNSVLMTMEAGTAFRIIAEAGDLWYVQVGDTIGYVEHLLCMINMPDVIPSIVYNNSNSESSLFMSRGNELEDVTSHKLYDTYFFNERFNEEQYAVPVLYSTAKLICAAQNLALQNGHTLVIYEAFRPADTQKKVCNALKSLIKSNKDVKAHTETCLKKWLI